MLTETFDLPEFWAVALLNDDTSHFNYADEKAFQAFAFAMTTEHGSCWPIDCTDQASFMTYHDARRFGVLACDTLTFTFDITPR